MSPLHRIHPVILKRAREMRHPQTTAEATLWAAIRNRSVAYKFRRQHSIDRFIVDFYCAQAKLCIEIDGDTHQEADQQEYDAARTEYLETLGYKVIRFTNDDVRYNINAVVAAIMEKIENILQTPSPFQGEGRDEGSLPEA
jgi:very-short-patch-repair endonuclease